MGIENFPGMCNLGNDLEEMEEEFEENPIIKQFESEVSLMDQVNNNSHDHGVHHHDPREPPKGHLEIQTIFGTMRQGDSPTSCLLKNSKETNKIS